MSINKGKSRCQAAQDLIKELLTPEPRELKSLITHVTDRGFTSSDVRKNIEIMYNNGQVEYVNATRSMYRTQPEITEPVVKVSLL